MNDIMLKIDNVSKQYRLGEIGGTTLRDELQRLGAKMRGKEDPTKRVGAKNYNKGEKFMALDSLSFEVKKGERVGIIGHNGAGKSTLLKLISRVTAPTGGTIYLNGRVTSMLEVGTGFHGELTGRENVYMNGAILGMTKKEIDAKMEDIIEFSEVRQFIDTPVKRYSSGMYVKLAFSVAAHLDSEIMIMDEVLAVGDMAFQKKCLDKMYDVSKASGKTILYVSHNMNTIRQLCDRCIVLDRGKVIFDGDIEKAIKIYLHNNNSITKTRRFNKLDHEKWCGTNLLVESCTILNDILDVSTGDVLCFEVEVSSDIDYSNLYVRLVVLNDYGVTIGAAVSEPVIKIQSERKNICKVSFDTSCLSVGKYTTKFSIFELSDIGGHDYKCVINDFMAFEIQDASQKNHGITWSVSSWGNTIFPALMIEE